MRSANLSRLATQSPLLLCLENCEPSTKFIIRFPLSRKFRTPSSCSTPYYKVKKTRKTIPFIGNILVPTNS